MNERLRFGLLLAGGVILFDQAVKFYMLGPLAFSPEGCRHTGVGCGYIDVSPIFDLQMVWNQGISFGLLQADSEVARWGLTLMQAAIAGAMFWWLRTASGKLTATALGLIIGGAIGNIIDRVRFGAVADFFNFRELFFPWVFNVADAAITCGAVLLAVDFIFYLEDPPGSGTVWQNAKKWFRTRLGRPDANSSTRS